VMTNLENIFYSVWYCNVFSS